MEISTFKNQQIPDIGFGRIIWGDNVHRRWKEIIIALMLGLVFPSILYSFVDKQKGKEPADVTQGTQIADTSADVTIIDVGVLMGNGTVEVMPLEDYLVSVVLREMPAEFEVEALKAQAVVARTYTLRRMEAGGKHADAAVCTDPSCCQGYYDQTEYMASGGTQALLDKVIAAVESTANEVVVYDDALIDATYFSCSGGRTEDALAVWGSDIPYLQSTESPGEEGASHYIDTVSFSTAVFAEKLDLDVGTQPQNWLGSIEYTNGGGVAQIQICGKSFEGTEIRQKLGLRSTAFIISVVGDTVTITTKGYGHRVGMSQYGADAMAVQGKTYQDILSHYYQGTDLIEYTG